MGIVGSYVMNITSVIARSSSAAGAHKLRKDPRSPMLV